MSGLIALLDDVAAIAKVAATSVDDIAAQATKAGMKAAGAVIDDAAVTPKYVQGFSPARELPIVGKIAWGSIRNKILILLPAALLLSQFAPWLITPLLMLGGSYLCFEGAEKIVHALAPHSNHDVEKDMSVGDPAHLEEKRVSGAIKTDFILSAEIMTIALAALPADASLWNKGFSLFIIAIGITVAVYGSVALIVKMDDIGLHLAEDGRTSFGRKFGLGLVKFMPTFLKILTWVGTAAMLWVGGSIVIHGLKDLGWALPYDTIHHWAEAAAHAVPEWFAGFTNWFVTAFFDGILGLVWGLILVPIVTKILSPFFGWVKGLFSKKEKAAH